MISQECDPAGKPGSALTPSPARTSGTNLADLPPLLRRIPRVQRWGTLDSMRGTTLTVAGFGPAVGVGDRVVVQSSARRGWPHARP